MKKALTLSLLLLADIVLLAHSAIPHHYHNGIPVTVSSGAYEADAEEAHVYDYRHHHHHEHNSATVEDCLLDKTSLLTDSGSQLPNASSGYSAFPLLCLPQPIFGGTAGLADLSPLPFAQKPYALPYYATLIARSLGLRAPPAC
ncbi:MAG: hypothetical protein LBL94_02645 [Prevotellaceae bacterium]|jgi:hypothetical protein|nr:hypothetical protein [Prevotellaceae bacterium]